MSFTEKIDVLDLVINLTREDLEKLEELVERLEKVTRKITGPDDTDLMRRFYERPGH